MALFTKLTDTVSGMLKNVFSQASPYEVNEVSSQLVKKCALVRQDGAFSLVRDSTYFKCIYQTQSNRFYSLFHLNAESEAQTLHSAYSYKLSPICSCLTVDRDTLQKLCESIREHQSWNSAHLAAHIASLTALRSPAVTKFINIPCDTTLVTPIMIAISTEDLQCIQEFIITGARVDLCDQKGDSVFHYAARSADPKSIQMLAARDNTLLNFPNFQGETPLHAACSAGQAGCVEQLLRCGVDPLIPTKFSLYPIHVAMDTANASCVRALCKWNREQVYAQDLDSGGTPLHWARNKECIYTLCEFGVNTDTPNNSGDTALHLMIRHNRLDCVMALLCKGSNADVIGYQQNNPLHLAIQIDDVNLVKVLIVFGANINGLNSDKKSPRHIVSTKNSTNSNKILYLLHCVGAFRCAANQNGCKEGCVSGGSFNGTPPNLPPVSSSDNIKNTYDEMVTDIAMAAAFTRSPSASGSSIMSGDPLDSLKPGGDRILSLDGGGIRGLILIQILCYLEKIVGRPIRNCFDWIAGTSTGGILALAIIHGKSIRYCQGLYFRLKDEVFVGSRPYPTEPLEKFMKKEFNENTRMNEIEYPKALITGVLGDRHPAELHFFRNYDPPGVDYQKLESNSKFEPVPRPNEQFVWQAARSSGAAPTYFKAAGRFLDGGLIANNPTLDALTEIHEYNMGLRSIGQGESVKPIHVVVSLGTGSPPLKAVRSVGVHRPEGVIDLARVAFGASALGELIVDQATSSNGRPVERVRAWCSMIGVPFFRLNPPISTDVSLDCTDDHVLIHTLWETQCYLYKNEHKLKQLASLLRD